MAYSTEARLNNELFWQDKEIRFNLLNNGTRICPGEKVIDRLDHIEDSKAGRDKIGRMYLTNLRLIWQSYSKQSAGLSIGYANIITYCGKSTNSKFRGICEVLEVFAKRDSSNKFLFIFTSLVPGTYKMLTIIQTIHNAYKATKIYRELKLRSAIMIGKQLRVLPHEKIYSKVNGAWNLSNDQGNLGTFYITNVRIVWHANLNENYNISLPYIQILTIKVRDSKFGPALVIETSETSGSYTLGFRIDPQERLHQVFKEISSCHQAHSTDPIFGIDVNLKKDTQIKQDIEKIQEDIEIEEKDSDILAAYLADGHAEKDREVVYSEELGLAIEKPKDGYSLASLWKVIPN